MTIYDLPPEVQLKIWEALNATLDHVRLGVVECAPVDREPTLADRSGVFPASGTIRGEGDNA